MGHRQLLFNSARGDPYFSQVVLSLHMESGSGGTVLTDSSQYAATLTRTGTLTTSTAQAKFGAASLLGAVSSYFETPNLARYNTNTQAFCFESWLYATGTPGFERPWQSGDGTGLFFIGLDVNVLYTNNIRIVASNVLSGLIGQWLHVAVVSDTTTLKLYVNGVVTGTPYTITGYPSSSSRAITVQNFSAGGQPWLGYQDDLRVTIGAPRYTGDFTPPTAPNPDF